MMMSKGRLSKKLALYPPRRMLEALGLKGGETVKYVLEGNKLIIEPLLDPLDLALDAEKWARTSVREFERESEEEQDELYS